MRDVTNPNDPEVVIPEGATVVRQSSWAWLWSLLPWVALAAFQLFRADPPFLALTFVLAAITSGPRYLRWRKTAYILTESHVVIQQGTMSKYVRYPVPIERITEMRTRPGYFGSTLGYRTVVLTLGEQGAVQLDSVPASSPLVEHIRLRLRPPGPQRP